jgi:hypothetical protein
MRGKFAAHGKNIWREFAASLPRRGKLAANCRGKQLFLL